MSDEPKFFGHPFVAAVIVITWTVGFIMGIILISVVGQ